MVESRSRRGRDPKGAARAHLVEATIEGGWRRVAVCDPRHVVLTELGLTLLFRGLRGLRLRCPPALVFASHDGLSPAGLHTRRTPTVARIARVRDAVCGSGHRVAALGPRRSSATWADGRIVRFGFLSRADERDRCRVPLNEIQRSAVRSALLTAAVGVFGPA